MKSTFAMFLIGLAIGGCVMMPRNTIVTCPGAPDSVVGRCQMLAATSSTQRDFLGAGVPVRGFGVVTMGSGGTRSATDIDDERYMRCMRQAGYNCIVENYRQMDGSVTPANSPYVVVPATDSVKSRELK